MEPQRSVDKQNIEVKQSLFTWSNLISISRILVAAPIVYLHYKNGQQFTTLIVVLVMYGILSDYLDGFVARRQNQVSEWGKMLDPIADKICAFILFFYTVYIGLIPLWFFIVEVIRDLLIMSGSTYIKLYHGKVAMAVMSGKWSVNALAAYWASAIFLPQVTGVQHFFMGITLALMFFSLIDYFHRFIRIQKGAEFN